MGRIFDWILGDTRGIRAMRYGPLWAEMYPTLTRIGIRPWDYPDMGDLDAKIARAIKLAAQKKDWTYER